MLCLCRAFCCTVSLKAWIQFLLAFPVLSEQSLLILKVSGVKPNVKPMFSKPHVMGIRLLGKGLFLSPLHA